MWYVIQVLKGREDAMAGLIARVVPESILDECFVPKFATEIKVRGRWIPCEKELFPGYLIAVTDSPERVEECLLRIPEFARVLRMGEEYAPLAEDEIEIIGGFTKRGNRVVPMSRAVKDGDRVVVTMGPLVGREGLIREIHRRKSTAILELNLCGRLVTTRVGLSVVSVPEDPAGKRAMLYKREMLQSA